MAANLLISAAKQHQPTTTTKHTQHIVKRKGAKIYRKSGDEEE